MSVVPTPVGVEPEYGFFLGDDDLFGAVEFDNAVGVVAEYSYSMFTVGYTRIDYSVFGADFDASHFSVRLTGAF